MTFEELGFEKGYDGSYPVYRKGNVTVMFDMDDETYHVSAWVSPRNMRQSVYIDKELHEAICGEIERLGWLDDSR